MSEITKERKEEVEDAMKTVGGHFGGADFDPAIFGTDDGGPIDAAREKLQRAFAVIKAALEKPAPPAEPCPGNLNCPTCLALERADDRKEKK